MQKDDLPKKLHHITNLRYDLIAWDKLTQEKLTELDKKGVSVLTHIVTHNVWKNLPPELKEFSLTQPAQGDDKIIHLMARKGKVKTIPKELITEELLSLKGNNGNSVYHVLAQESYADHIDPKLWTKKALTLTANEGYTPLHIIAQYRPELLPKDIALSDLLLEDKDKDTPLYRWARGSRWSEIPDKFLTRETLEMKVGYGDFETIMHHLAVKFKCDQVLKSPKDITPLDIKMKKMLAKIGDELLASLSKNEGPSLSRHIKAEIAKRKMVKELPQSEQSLEI